MSTCYVQGIDHIRFYVGNAMQSSSFYCHKFGFKHKAFRGLQTGDRQRCTYVIAQNNITFAFTSSLVPNDVEFHEELRRHGDTVKDVALTVSNVREAYQVALNGGAKSIQEPTIQQFDNGDYIEVAVVKPIFGNWVHTLINRSNQLVDTTAFLPGYRATKRHVTNSTSTGPNNTHKDLLDFVDHIAFAIEKDSVHQVVKWYRSCFGFERFLSHDDDDSDHGLSISSDSSSGLTTMTIAPPAASSCTSALIHDFKFVLVEPVNQNNTKSQIQEFLDFHTGPGVAHIALSTDDIVSAVANAHDEGVDFISVPDTYYSIWKEQRHSQYGSVKEDWTRIQDNSILVDGSQLDDRQFRYLLQTFTLPLQDRPTFYLEVISRRGNNGFGKGNIKSLFDAIERLQKERGNYEV